MDVQDVTLRAQEVRSLLAAGSGEAALLLLYLRGGGALNDAAKALGFDARQLDYASASLRQMGLLPERVPAHLQPSAAPVYSEQDLAREYGAYETVSEAVFDPARLAAAEERHASWEWRMGATPAFNLTLETRFPWGGLELAFVLQNGVVQEARAWSDAMDEAFIRALPDALLGAPLTGAALAAAVQRLGGALAEDIAAWLETAQW